MEKQTVNQRILVLKKESKLSDTKFCHAAGISTGTLHRIKQGGDVTEKTVSAVANAFGVELDWLTDGVGQLKFSGPAPADNGWQAAYNDQKEQNEFLKKEIEWLRTMMSSMVGKQSFLKGFDLAGLLPAAGQNREYSLAG